MKGFEEQLTYLGDFYPGLYVFVQRSLNHYARIEEYMLKCRKSINDPEKYDYHVYGFFIPWLDEQRA